MSVTVTHSASLTINGITTTGGVGLTLLANPELAITNDSHGDYFAETFTVNPLTTATTKALGDIATGAVIWIQTDLPITITLTQNSVDNDFVVDSFIYLKTAFTAIKIANASATEAAHINLVAAGARVVNPGTPGIY